MKTEPPNRTRIKICGIRTIEHALVCADAGADAIGFVFYEPSPRYISAAQAAIIIHALPPFVTSVGLFVNATAAEVHATIGETKLDLLQFHGDETPEFCEQFARPYIRAVRVGPLLQQADLLEYASRFASAQALLLDAQVNGQFGGTGHRFDWSIIPPSLASKIVLSGGLDTTNVEQAVKAVRPFAVDVSSGVEMKVEHGASTASGKGNKDSTLIRQFIQAVVSADQSVADQT